ncbi:MAG: hypothetical protein ABWZ16_09025 [Microbacterium sp.]
MSGAASTDDVQPEASAQRSDAGVGGAVNQDSGEHGGAEAVQDEPVLEQNPASTQDKLDGIAAQTRADLGGESDDRYEEVLRQRLADADIQLTDDDVRNLAQRSSPGSGGGGV